VDTNTLIDKVARIVGHAPQHNAAAIAWAADNAWWICLAAVAAIATVGTLRLRAARGALRDRAAFEVLPSLGFDPSPEDVARFTHRIFQAVRGASRWRFGTHRGSAIRVRLVSTGGPVSLRFEGPAAAISVLQHQGFAHCEMRPVTDAGSEAEVPVPDITFALPGESQ